MKKHFETVPTVLAAFALMVAVIGTNPTAVVAQEAKLTVRGSGLPVPRFVTLKFNEANMRTGPGSEYPVSWQYQRTGLPMLVDAEFGVWRKVVDHEGTTGWMHGSVLSLRRMALVVNGTARMHRDPDENSKVLAVAERGALLELQSCPADWCKVASENVRGWMPRSAIWGLRKGEALD